MVSQPKVASVLKLVVYAATQIVLTAGTGVVSWKMALFEEVICKRRTQKVLPGCETVNLNSWW